MLSMSGLLLTSLFVGTVIIMMLAFQAGVRIGRWRSRKPHPEPSLPVRTLVSSILSLLAFILGFTFGLASSHFDSRSRSVFEESVAIGTAYRRADFVAEPARSNVRRLLLEYLDVRLEVGRSLQDEVAIARMRRLQNEIWAEAVAAAANDTGRPSVGPLVQSLTEVIGPHAESALADIRSRIPFTVWMILYGIMILSILTAGYQAGLAGARRSIAALAYACVFSAVIVLIAAGDIPGSDQIQSNHKALVDLRARLAHRTGSMGQMK